MKTAFYRHLDDLEGKNISIRYQTNRGSYFPAHWHPAVELLYILNGTAEITISGQKIHPGSKGNLLLRIPTRYMNPAALLLIRKSVCTFPGHFWNPIWSRVSFPIWCAAEKPLPTKTFPGFWKSVTFSSSWFPFTSPSPCHEPGL